MTLPTSRNTTYTAGSYVKSADLNAIQDCIAGRKRPSIRRWFGANGHPTDAGHVPAGSISFSNGNLVFAAASTIDNLILPGWEVGDRITGFAVRFFGNGGAVSMKFDLCLDLGAGAAPTVNTLTVANPAASWNTYTLGLATPIVLADGNTIYFRTTQQASLVSAALAGIGIDSDRL